MEYLTDKELQAIFTWCEENNNPLSDAYTAACGAVGNVWVSDKKRPSDFYKYMHKNFSPKGLDSKLYSCEIRAVKLRDYLGRFILQIIEKGA